MQHLYSSCRPFLSFSRLYSTGGSSLRCLTTLSFKNTQKCGIWYTSSHYAQWRSFSNSTRWRRSLAGIKNFKGQTKPASNSSISQAKPNAYQRLKVAFKKYWYVLVPVHVATTAFWYGSIYYLIASGVDVVGILEWAGVSERILQTIRNMPHAGTIALTLAVCKVISPIRYGVTLGVTALSVRYLVHFGLIKPAPDKEQIQRYAERQRTRLKERYQRFRSNAKGIRGKLTTKWKGKNKKKAQGD